MLANPRDVLVDESKQADIDNLGDCLRALGDGQSLGDFSLTIVLYGRSKAELDQLGAEFAGVFTCLSLSSGTLVCCVLLLDPFGTHKDSAVKVALCLASAKRKQTGDADENS